MLEINGKTEGMSQWFLNITDYTQELLDGLEQIDFPNNEITSTRLVR